MVGPRVKETEVGIVGLDVTAAYDRMQRCFRDRGWIETGSIIKSGISSGLALEIGPGPGYTGLEWLKQTQGTLLTGLELSPDMTALAQKNAAGYGLTGRAAYVLGNSMDLPFEDHTFDGVFSTGSLHEWEHPQAVMDQIIRVLKPGGRFFVGDLRRDINPLFKALMWLTVRPAAMRPGLRSSLRASYIKDELEDIVSQTRITDHRIKIDPTGLALTGRKED